MPDEDSQTKVVDLVPLRDLILELRETLYFYADKSNYEPFIDRDYQFTGESKLISEAAVVSDEGDKAQWALNKIFMAGIE